MTTKLPIALAKNVLDQYDLEQVIVLCRAKDGSEHFVTYGDTPTSCQEAAISADRLKRAFGWPEGSLSAYVTECLIPGCEAEMPHFHDRETGVAVSPLLSNGNGQ